MKMKNASAPSLRPEVERFEEREVPAAITFSSRTGIVTITGSSQDDLASVAVIGSDVKVDLKCYSSAPPNLEFFVDSKTFSASAVKSVTFKGLDGADKFTNDTSIKSTAYGGPGNDQVNGGGNRDRLYGDIGSDIVHGNGGNDQLYGGGGGDKLYGDSGSDVLVAIGGGYDSLTGGSESDNFWMDTSDTSTDASPTENFYGYIHKVGQFVRYSYDGGATSTFVSKELLGQSLAEPNPYPGILFSQNFKTKPLFASGGPSMNDVFQGSVGDCYLMASLSAIAKANPEVIRRMVVDLGDGSYAVRFYRNGQPQYVRVDADLWYDPLSGKPIYAKLGQEGSLWVPIVEKAYAFWRMLKGSYPSIAGGNASGTPVYDDLGRGSDPHQINDGVTAKQVINWFNAGSPDGAIKDKVIAGATDMLDWIRLELQSGNAVVVGAVSNFKNTTPLQVDDPSTAANENTFRRGQHVFVVDKVLTDSSGPIGLRLRNPYGTQGPNHDGYIEVTDLTRIYFCISRAVSIDA
jgi:hypothetical protein